jgi:hypothetical protein
MLKWNMLKTRFVNGREFGLYCGIVIYETMCSGTWLQMFWRNLLSLDNQQPLYTMP